ncbi:ABC transporter permease [Microbacterium jejuense]|uniref:ABC transporter permease n=1 Tax=Microbacterium jejuense TaxID=1263637 RepID=A0ABS7HJD3_9MICO|nr:ABC transporter permease [Microbacterium jejuense]MBW9093061.1 ABC transporter permease [Microbacterium jejuense]
MNRKLQRVRDAFRPIHLVALGFILLVVVLSLAAPVILPDPLAQDGANTFAPLGTPGHLLGTDGFGRDTLARLMAGVRTELAVALATTLLALVIGTTLGISGAYFGAVAETLTMRIIVDVLLAFPPIIFALLIVTIYGPGPATLTFTMGVLFAMNFARIAYGQTLTVRRAEYVDAARAYGAPTLTILVRTVLPNISAPLIVQASLTMAAAILLESGLSFLGLGLVPPAPSMGLMIADGQRYMASDPLGILIPSIAVVVIILAFSVLSDGLGRWLDPRRRNAHA